MREIKFRGMALGRMIYGDLLKETDESYSICDEYAVEECFVQAHSILVNKKTIGQYTGLKDKNGKEIYEGDIVNCKYMHDWNIPEWWTHDNKPKNVVIEDIRNIPYEIEEYTDYFEVIGNVYENPNLLEV